MRTGSPRILLIVLVCSGGILLVGGGHGQSFEALALASPGRFYCSPAPCVLPPTQASEGGSTVTDTPVVSIPRIPKQLLLGSVDCQLSRAVGFGLPPFQRRRLDMAARPLHALYHNRREDMGCGR